MRTIYRTLILAAIAFVSIAGCGNAEARKDKKKNTEPKKAVIELNTEQFGEKVYDIKKDELAYLGDKPAIVDFTASWCGPCQRIAPILEELAVEYKDKIVVYKVDVDQNKELARSFNVSSVPAVLFIPLNGDPVMTVGSRDKARFENQIETLLLGK